MFLMSMQRCLLDGSLFVPFTRRDAPPALANASNQEPTLLYLYQGLLVVVLLCMEMF